MKKKFEDFLKDLAQKDKIICNYDLFKIKLEISPETYSFLSKAANLKDFVGALSSIAAGSSIGILTWWSTSSALTQFLFSLGLISFPISYPLIGGLAGFATFLGLKKLADTRKKFVKEIPKFITAPIDILGFLWLSLILPLLLKIASADGEIHPKELEQIKYNLINKWGYCKDFVDSYIEKLLQDSRFEEFSYDEINKILKKILKLEKGLNKESLIFALIREVEEIIESDGIIHPKEKEELQKLKKALGLK